MDEVALRVVSALAHESEHHAIVLPDGFQFVFQFHAVGIEQKTADARERVGQVVLAEGIPGIFIKEFETVLVHALFLNDLGVDEGVACVLRRDEVAVG